MSGRNWGKARDRARMQRQGTEAHDVELPGPWGHLPTRARRPPPQQSEPTIAIKCTACGHRGPIPQAARARPRRCHACGNLMKGAS